MSIQPNNFDVVPKPDVPMALKSHLKPADGRMEEMERVVFQRIEEISREMGLNGDGTVNTGSWMGNRMNHQDLFDGKLDWRRAKHQGIFLQSNLSLGIAQRMAREAHAKASDDVVGTRPFFAAVKTDTGNSSIARAVEELVQQKVDRSTIQLEIRSALRSAIIRNECVMKIRHVKRATFYYGPATVYVDEHGVPILTPNGLFVYEFDDLVADPDVQGQWRLKKDPLFTMTDGQYQKAEFEDLRQEAVDYEGVECGEIDFRSFLCPLMAPDIHQADWVFQLVDLTPEQVREVYGTYEGFDAYIDSTRTDEGSGERQPKEAHGEDLRMGSTIDVRRRYAEGYGFFDADGDGVSEHVFVMIDRSCRKIIFAEYLANLMPKRPFEVIPGLSRVPNRWYGEGVIQAVMDPCTYIDCQFNRENVRDSQEYTYDFIDRMGIKDLANGAKIVANRGQPYEVKQGYSAQNPPIFRVNLMEKSELGREMMHEAMQQVNLAFCIIDAKSAAESTGNRTATYVLNSERTANLHIKNTEVQQQAAVIRIMEQVTTLVLENLQDTELLLTKDGKELLTINRNEARTISREVRLLLTRSRSTELLSSNQQAIAIGEKYHVMVAQMPATARDLRPMFLQSLKALEVPDPDEACPEVTDEMIAAWQKQQQDTTSANLRRETREAINYADLAPSEQAQWVQDMGITPAPEEERTTSKLLEKLIAVYDKLPPSIQSQLDALVGLVPAAPQERIAIMEMQKPAPSSPPDKPSPEGAPS